MNSSSDPLISVVVPTRDRPNALARCLEALGAQTVADRLEVVVVDDGSTSQAAVSSLVALHGATLLRLEGDGPAAARNAGAGAARGSHICFTDDDCAPAKDWVEQLVEALRTGADAAGGKTIARGGSLAEASEIIARAPVRVISSDGVSVDFAPSNNLACTKEVSEATPFDESYPNAAGEDRDWCARLVASGHTLRFVPTAHLVHHQDLTLLAFLRQQARYGEGAFRFRRHGAVSRPLEAPSFYAALLRRGFARGIAVGLLVCAAQVATGVGFARGWLGHRSSRWSDVTRRT